MLPPLQQLLALPLVLSLLTSSPGCQATTTTTVSASWDRCVDQGSKAISEACHETQLEFGDDDVDMDSFQEPDHGFDLEDAVAEITAGTGYYLVKSLFSQRDVEIARDRVSQQKKRKAKIIINFL